MAVNRRIVVPLIALLSWPVPARAAKPEQRLVVSGSVAIGIGAAAFVTAVPLHIRYRIARRAWDEHCGRTDPVGQSGAGRLPGGLLGRRPSGADAST